MRIHCRPRCPPRGVGVPGRALHCWFPGQRAWVALWLRRNVTRHSPWPAGCCVVSLKGLGLGPRLGSVTLRRSDADGWGGGVGRAQLRCRGSRRVSASAMGGSQPRRLLVGNGFSFTKERNSRLRGADPKGLPRGLLWGPASPLGPTFRWSGVCLWTPASLCSGRGSPSAAQALQTSLRSWPGVPRESPGWLQLIRTDLQRRLHLIQLGNGKPLPAPQTEPDLSHLPSPPGRAGFEAHGGGRDSGVSLFRQDPWPLLR